MKAGGGREGGTEGGQQGAPSDELGIAVQVLRGLSKGGGNRDTTGKELDGCTRACAVSNKLCGIFQKINCVVGIPHFIPPSRGRGGRRQRNRPVARRMRGACTSPSPSPSALPDSPEGAGGRAVSIPSNRTATPSPSEGIPRRRPTLSRVDFGEEAGPLRRDRDGLPSQVRVNPLGGRSSAGRFPMIHVTPVGLTPALILIPVLPILRCSVPMLSPAYPPIRPGGADLAVARPRSC